MPAAGAMSAEDMAAAAEVQPFNAHAAARVRES
jgi:hypothetical protein